MKEFKVAVISANTNSFGLHGVLLLARDGETWEAGVNDLHLPELGATFNLDSPFGRALAALGWEIPRIVRLPNQSNRALVEQIWQIPSPAADRTRRQFYGGLDDLFDRRET